MGTDNEKHLDKTDSRCKRKKRLQTQKGELTHHPTQNPEGHTADIEPRHTTPTDKSPENTSRDNVYPNPTTRPKPTNTEKPNQDHPYIKLRDRQHEKKEKTNQKTQDNTKTPPR